MAYVVKATIPVAPDKRAQAAEIAAEMSRASRTEDGVIDHRSALGVEEDVLRVFEHYEDLEAIDAHMNTDHFAEFQRQSDSFMGDESDLEVIQFEIADSVGFEESRVAQNL